ncbi:hypothetical protein IKX64_01195 [Candidatus Saccharibacteria bacterium]|nr:hypothetical protein [Candidatus Saccharibacteria bacterium]
MGDKYDALGFFIIGIPAGLIGALLFMLFLYAITGENYFDSDLVRPEATPTEAVSCCVSEQADPSIVPWELVRKMYYSEDKYWVDINNVPYEIRRCKGAEGGGQYYYVNPLPTS